MNGVPVPLGGAGGLDLVGDGRRTREPSGPVDDVGEIGADPLVIAFVLGAVAACDQRQRLGAAGLKRGDARLRQQVGGPGSALVAGLDVRHHDGGGDRDPDERDERGDRGHREADIDSPPGAQPEEPLRGDQDGEQRHTEEHFEPRPRARRILITSAGGHLVGVEGFGRREQLAAHEVGRFALVGGPDGMSLLVVRPRRLDETGVDRQLRGEHGEPAAGAHIGGFARRDRQGERRLGLRDGRLVSRAHGRGLRTAGEEGAVGRGVRVGESAVDLVRGRCERAGAFGEVGERVGPALQRRRGETAHHEARAHGGDGEPDHEAGRRASQHSPPRETARPVGRGREGGRFGGSGQHGGNRHVHLLRICVISHIDRCPTG